MSAFVVSNDRTDGGPNVPNATATTKWKSYLWRRSRASASGESTVLYGWDDTATSDATYLKWKPIGQFISETTLTQLIAGSTKISLTLDNENGNLVFDVVDANISAAYLLNREISSTAPSDDDVYMWSSSTSKWTPYDIKGYVDAQILTEDTIAELNDTDITGPANLDVLQHNGTNWVDRTYAEAGLVSLTGSETLTNKTLTTPTLTSPVFNTGVSGTAVKNEDDMASDSDTHLATQQSIKAYVDNEVGIHDAINLVGDTLATNVLASSLTSVGTLSSLAVEGNLTVDTDTLFVDSTNNRVGIGTINGATPGEALHLRTPTESEDISLRIDSKDFWYYITNEGYLGNVMYRSDAGMSQIFKVRESGENSSVYHDALTIASTGLVGVGGTVEFFNSSNVVKMVWDAGNAKLGVNQATASTYSLEVSGTAFAQSTDNGGSGVYGVSGQAGTTGPLYGVQGHIGSAVTSPAVTGFGVYGICSGRPDYGYGVQGKVTGACATNTFGVRGIASGVTTTAYGGHFSAEGGTSANYAVMGLADESSASYNVGGYFRGTSGTTNIAIKTAGGDVLLSNNADETKFTWDAANARLGINTTPSAFALEVTGTVFCGNGAGSGTAGKFAATGNNGTGVLGSAGDADSTGSIYGIYGYVDSSVDSSATTGTALRGSCAGSPVTGYGVHGSATGAGTTNYGGSFTGSGAADNYGVMGLAGASTSSAYAGSFNASGAVGVNSYGIYSSTTATRTAGDHFGVYGKSIVVTGSGTRTNYGGYFEASGAANNYAIQTGAGNVRFNDDTATGKFIFDAANGGRVGIGKATTSTYELEVAGEAEITSPGAGGVLGLVNAQGNFWMGVDTTSAYLQTSSGEDFRIIADSTIALSAATDGTINLPQGLLDIAGDSGSTNQVITRQSDGTVAWQAAQGGSATVDIGSAIGNNSIEGSILFVDSSETLGQQNSELFWDDAAYRLGIGTNQPSRSLDVDGKILGDAYGFRSDSAVDWYYFDDFSGSNFMGLGGNTYVSMYVAGTQAMVWDGADVGIGRIPTKDLDVYRSSGWAEILVDGGTGGQITFSEAGTQYGAIFANDPASNGMVIRSGAGTGMEFRTNTSTVAAIITSDGDVKIEEKLGVGGVTPTHPLQVQHADTGTLAALKLENNYASGADASAWFKTVDKEWTIGVDQSNSGAFTIANDSVLGATDKLTITTGGNVGVGTNIPTERLELFEDTGNNDTETGIRISSYLVGGVLDDKYGLRLYTARDTSGVPYATIKAPRDELADLRFTTGSSDETRMVIDASGLVGIGTETPSLYNSNTNNLVIHDSGSGGITVSTGASSSGYYAFHSDALDIDDVAGLIEYNHSTNEMSFRTNEVDDRLVISSGGEVGINATPSSGYKLYVNGDTLYSGNIKGNSPGGYIQLDGASSTTAWTMGADGGTLAPGTGSTILGLHHWSGSAWTNPVNVTAAGNVGIGASVVIKSDGTGAYYTHSGSGNTILASSDGNEKFVANDTGYLQFEVEGAIAGRWNSTGLGIGHDDPSDYHANAQNLVIKDTGGNCGITLAVTDSANYSSIFFADGTGTAAYNGYVEYQHTPNTMVFGVAEGGHTMKFDSTGLGIGGVTPSTTLHLKSADPVIRLEDSSPDGIYGSIDGAGGALILSADQTAGQADSNIQFKVDNAVRMRIDSSGNVGIGEPAAINGKLHVNGNIVTGTYGTATTGEGFRLSATDLYGQTGASDKVLISVNGDSYFKGGNVGIGTASPKRHLHIHGGDESTKLQITNANTPNSGTIDDGDGFQIAISQAGVAWIEQRENYDLAFSTNNDERMRMYAGGDIKVFNDLGIGLTASAPLHVKSSADTTAGGILLKGSDGVHDIVKIYATTESGIRQGAIELADGSTTTVYLRADAGPSFINTGGNFGIGTNSPSANLETKGLLNTALSDTTTNGYGAFIASTGHGLSAGDSVKLPSGAASAFEIFTVATVTDADNFVVDSTPTNDVVDVTAYKDSNLFSILNGDGVSKLLVDSSGQIKITGGSPGASKVLTSDANGLATWEDAAGGGTITALNNQAANRLVSIGATTTELDGEANLTFDGSTLAVPAGSVGIGTEEATNAKLVVNHTGTSSPVDNVELLGTSITTGGGTGIFLKADDSTTASRFGARINTIREASNDGSTSLVFSTDDSSSLNEALRIDSDGAFGIAGANYGTSGQVLTSGGSSAAPSWAALPVEIGVACSDETTALETGAGKVMFMIPHDMTLTGVKASLSGTESDSGGLYFDVNYHATDPTIAVTVFSSAQSIGQYSYYHHTSALSTTTLAENGFIVVDIDGPTTPDATGLKIWLIGTRT